MRLTRLQIALLAALVVVLMSSAGMILYQFRQLTACRQQRAADLQSLRELRAALDQHNLEKAPVEAPGETPVGDNRSALAARGATIEQLTRELSEARLNITELQTQLLNSSNEREKALASASEHLRTEQADWQSRFDGLKQEVDNAAAELQVSRQHIADLEAANAKLRADNGESSARTADFARQVAGLQDLDRRRDAYLTSIIRRYHDITSQFRSMSGMLDSKRDQDSGVLSGAALTRIQDAIALADDDLRQLNELNAQARQLQKKLTDGLKRQKPPP